MIKRILLFALVNATVWGGLQAQHLRKAKSSEIQEKLSKESIQQDLMRSEDFLNNPQRPTLSVPTNTTEAEKTPTKSHKTSALNVIKIGTSSNAYTIIRNLTNHVMANDKFKTVAWLHRQNIDVWGGSPTTTANGVLRLDYSTDNGNTFPDNQIDVGPFNPLPYGPPNFPYSVTARARYPQGVLYFPPDAQSIKDARLVWLAAITDGGGWGNYNYGIAKNLDSFGKNQFNVKKSDCYYNFISRFQDRRVVIPGGFCQGRGSEFWTFDNTLLNGGTGTTLDSLLLWKGTANIAENTINWTRHQVFRRNWLANRNGSMYAGSADMAFSPDKKWGWALTIGTTKENYQSEKNVYEGIPTLWYSSDSGVTWSDKPIEAILRDLPLVRDSLRSGIIDQETGDTTWSSQIPSVWDHKMTIDKDGNPHIFMLVLNASRKTLGANAADVDSVGYASTGFRRMLIDLTTYDHGRTWCPKFISDVTAIRGQLGGTDLTWNNHIQISRNEAGTHIFYSWMDDTTATSPQGMTKPNVFEAALRIADDARVAPRSLSIDDATWAGDVRFPAISPTVLTTSPGNYNIPTVFVKILTNETTPCDFYYIKNRNISEDMFVKPTSDVSITVPADQELCGDRTYTVSGKFKNLSKGPVSGKIALQYTVNGTTTVNETLTLATPLAVGAEQDFSFAQKADIAQSGTYVVDVVVQLPNDQFCENHAKQFRVMNFGGVSSQIFSAPTASGCGVLSLNTRLEGLKTTWYQNNKATELTQFKDQSMILLDKTIVSSNDLIIVEVEGPAACAGRVLRDTVKVIINDDPATDLKELNQICLSAGPLVLEATPNPDAIDVKWMQGTQTVHRESKYSISKNGQYIVVLTDKITGCSITKNVAALLWDIKSDLSTRLKSPFKSCLSQTIEAANASAPDGYGVRYTWYIGGTASLEGEPNKVFNINDVFQDGTSSSIVSVVESLARAMTYKVIIRDPLGCNPAGVADSVIITSYDTVQANWKITYQGKDVTDTEDRFCCDQWITFKDASRRFRTDFTARLWRVLNSQGSTTEGALGSATTFGADEIRVKWPCTRLGPKAVQLIPYSGTCKDTIRLSFSIFKDTLVCPVGMEEAQKMGMDLSVYPNPSQDLFNIDFTQAALDNVTITLRDVQGRVLQVQETGRVLEYKQLLNLAGRASGLYLLEFRNSRGTVVQKLMKAEE